MQRARELLGSLESPTGSDADDAAGERRISELEAALAELERDREQRLARQLAALEQQLATAKALIAERDAAAERAREKRSRADERVERARENLREAERAVEAARRETARVGGELAAVNHFLRAQAPNPDGAGVLADELQVDAGYELALSAALDGRLRAAVVSDQAAARALLDKAGVEGGRALVAGAPAGADAPRGSAPTGGAERLADHVRGGGVAADLARALLRDTWVVETLDAIPDTFAGVAVTRAGRVWSAANREVRQAPAVGEERVLAERNRREELIAATESAAQAELHAAERVEVSSAEYQAAEGEREGATAAHRAAVRERDESAEDARRVEATIERRRSAPDETPAEERRRQVAAELAAERDRIERARRERTEREARIGRLRASLAGDQHLLPQIRALIGALDRVGEAISAQHAAFEAALVSDREAGEHVAAELRACAHEEATIQSQLHRCNETLTEAEVRLQRTRDRADEGRQELQALAGRLELEAAPATEPLSDEERGALTGRLERLTRRREQIGPVNPLAQQEYAEAVEHVEELERQRADLETALRELEKLIADTDRQIRHTFEQTFAAAARNFEQVAAHLFPGGRGRLRLVADEDRQARVLGGAPSDGGAGPEEGPEADEAEEAESGTEEDLLGVEIEINPAGKEMKRLTLLSGGEKSLTALAFLFAVFLARPCPFYILDEVEAALDDLNIDRFLGLLRTYSQRAQFIVVTHQRRTMEAADFLYGVSMGADGVSKVISQRLPQSAAA
jgi:chromosome segregation protein